jgi:putative sterol carrier protein
MATLEEITERMREAVGSDSGLGKSVKFDFGADGIVRIDGGTVDNQDQPADCTIQVSKTDFEAMGRGELDPTMAFMSGKLKIQGDMSVAMKLQPLLAKARG